MKSDASNRDEIAVTRAGLPIKITGLVFWGLVIVGLSLTFLLLPNLERQTAERVAINAERFAYQM